MWSYEHSVVTDAPPEAVYRAYAETDRWPVWDASLERVLLHGPFAAGTEGVISVKGQGDFPLRLTAVRPNAGFDDATEIADAGITLNFTHVLTPSPEGGTRITHGLTITGPAAAQVGPQMGPQITADFPESMEALAAYAARLTDGAIS